MTVGNVNATQAMKSAKSMGELSLRILDSKQRLSSKFMKVNAIAKVSALKDENMGNAIDVLA